MRSCCLTNLCLVVAEFFCPSPDDEKEEDGEKEGEDEQGEEEGDDGEEETGKQAETAEEEDVKGAE